MRAPSAIAAVAALMCARFARGADFWINEFHYNNAGPDSGEFIEIAGDASADINGWTIVLYNGASNAEYGSVTLATGPGFNIDASSEDSGVAFYAVDFATNGIQNGGRWPDGIALVDPEDTVVEFISYEGEMTAADGPAAGMTSVDIGIAQSYQTPVGESLQRTGSICAPASWVSAPRTRGAINYMQYIEVCVLSIPDLFFNEFHYNDIGVDDGEFIEVAGNINTDLTDWSIALYNGNDDQVYDTVSLTGGALSNEVMGVGFYVVGFPTNGIQNGAPDGMALVDPVGNVVEFISYEGEITAAGGPAAGLTSKDIGVAEGATTGEGMSLQLTDNACAGGVWSGPLAETPGAPNAGQFFDCPDTCVATPISTYNPAAPLPFLDAFNFVGGTGEIWAGPIGDDGKLLAWTTPGPISDPSPPVLAGTTGACDGGFESLVTSYDTPVDTAFLESRIDLTWSKMISNGWDRLPHCDAKRPAVRHQGVFDSGIQFPGYCCRDCTPDDGVIYMRSKVWSSEARNVTIDFISNDGAVLWVNGERILTDHTCNAPTESHAQPFEVTLAAGWNVFDLKQRNHGGNPGAIEKNLGFVLKLPVDEFGPCAFAASIDRYPCEPQCAQEFRRRALRGAFKA